MGDPDLGKSQAGKIASRVERRGRLLSMVASGCTITDAAAAIGVSRKTASGWYQQELAAAAQRNRELSEHLIAQDLETIRLLMRAHMPNALDGDQGAAKVILACLDRRSKLLGLDAAVKVEISNARVEDVVGRILELTGQAPPVELLPIDPPLVIEAPP